MLVCWTSLFVLLCFVFNFMTIPVAYGSSQARGLIWAVAADLYHSNATSLTHWARPGIELESSWMLVRFVTAESWWELPEVILIITFGDWKKFWIKMGEEMCLEHICIYFYKMRYYYTHCSETLFFGKWLYFHSLGINLIFRHKNTVIWH